MSTSIQLQVRRARLASTADVLGDHIRQEVAKGCTGDVSPAPMPLEPPFSDLRSSATDRSPAEADPGPPDAEQLLRFTAWISPLQKCRWSDSEQFLKSLVCAEHRLGFEIVGNRTAIAIRLLAQREDVGHLKVAFCGQFEQCQLHERDAHAEAWNEALRSAPLRMAEFFPRPPYHRRFTGPEELTTTPLKTLIAALMLLPDSVLGVYQVLFAAASPDHAWHENVRRLHDWEYRIQTFGGGLPQQQFTQQIPSAALTAMSHCQLEKAHNDKPFFSVVPRVAVLGDHDRIDDCLKALATFMSQYQQGGYGLQQLRESAMGAAIEQPQLRTALRNGWSHRHGFLLNSEELTSLVHLPPLSVVAEMEPPITRLSILTIPPSAERGISVGVASVAGEEHPVRIQPRVRHAHVHLLGVPGKGKSSLMKAMALQDICNNEGVLLLDPHGGVARELLHLVPREHAGRVIYLHFGDPELIPLWNPLTPPPGVDPGIVTDEIIRALRSFMTGWGDRLEHLLRLTILSLLQVPGSTMHDISTLLSYKSEKAKEMVQTILAATNNSMVHRFWNSDFSKYGPSDLTPPQHKLSKLLASGAVGAMLSHPENSFSLRQLMDDGGILLVDLSGIGTDLCDAVGAMMLSLTYTAALGRPPLEDKPFRPFHIYADEAHRFMTDAMAKIIDETRKFRVSLTLAHQRFSQFGRQDQHALSDCRTSVFFALNTEDAARVARTMQNRVDAEDLLSLPCGQAIAHIDGQLTELRTPHPDSLPKGGAADHILQRSHATHYRRREAPREAKASAVSIDRRLAGLTNEEIQYDEF